MIITRANGRLFPELRRWGLILMVDGKTIGEETGKPLKIKRNVINAMAKKLTTSCVWRVVSLR